MHRLAALVLAMFSLAVAAPQPTTILLVRHAEKASAEGGMTADPPLTAAGAERAKELARVLAGTKLAAVYTTPYKRTRDTAIPVAAAHGLAPIEIAAGNSYARDLVSRITFDHSGETVLVVGHSNTTPEVLRQLGIAEPPNIADSQYDDLFIVTLAPNVAPRLLALRYGAASR